LGLSSAGGGSSAGSSAGAGSTAATGSGASAGAGSGAGAGATAGSGAGAGAGVAAGAAGAGAGAAAGAAGAGAGCASVVLAAKANATEASGSAIASSRRRFMCGLSSRKAPERRETRTSKVRHGLLLGWERARTRAASSSGCSASAPWSRPNRTLFRTHVGAVNCRRAYSGDAALAAGEPDMNRKHRCFSAPLGPAMKALPAVSARCDRGERTPT
jgi:hypothetical protein